MELLERGPALAALHWLSTRRWAARAGSPPSPARRAWQDDLVEAFAAAGPRVRVLAGACDPLLTPRALGPLHDIAHRLGGAARRLDGARRASTCCWRRCGAEPAVLVLEDLHWADEATLDWSRSSAAVWPRCRRCWCSRSATMNGADDHRPRARRAAARPRRRLPLPPLSPEAVAVWPGRAAEVPR